MCGHGVVNVYVTLGLHSLLRVVSLMSRSFMNGVPYDITDYGWLMLVFPISRLTTKENRLFQRFQIDTVVIFHGPRAFID